ncbi:MAG: hypothetical protein GVY07_01425 [Bacteroidetes bacterium]|jgi:hypothetical protein|nr:hypothetical protein [Bacteroidota bacterium]
MEDKSKVKNNEKAFRQVLIWSGVLFVAAILFGFLYRVIYPVELYLDDNEYQTRVFVESETRAWQKPDSSSTLIGTYDAGAILYALETEDEFYLVRPFVISEVDSVWIPKDSTTSYTSEEYRRWQYEAERRKFDLE